MLRSTGLIRKSIYSQEQPDAMAQARAQGKITQNRTVVDVDGAKR
ncbi:hypothetical protein [Limnohabitans sp. Rim8]